MYEPQFLEKFVDVNQKDLKLIYEAIIEGMSLIVSYKGSEFFKIQPLKVFVYNGIMYLCALIENKTFRTFHISGLKIIDKHSEKPDKFLSRKFRKTTFLFEEEKPFLFGARVAFKESLSFFKNPLLFPTQFYLKKEEERHFEVFLVGFTGYRFASRFLVEEIIEILPPDKSIIKKAKEKELTKHYPELIYSLKENRKRFQSFLKTFDTLIKQRQKLISNIDHL
ncbi:WYL domain-containing protein [Desulfurobacterium sp. TC5-1]|uniref:WYL domain-containing protein n=1 Tax=Desulfurobacterium sp. TC5-1 TaxID=1158318 RepID=UPI0003B71C68|nr:WYL domain-containing protein [Desulfurobacterium sp. TC5-1]